MGSKSMGKVEGQLEGIIEDLKEVTRLLLGDGQPGLVQKSSEMCEQVGQLVTLSKNNLEAIGILRSAITDLTIAQKVHAESNGKHSLWGMIGRREVLAGLVSGFAILHTVLEYIPAGWTWLRSLLGF